MKLRIFSSAMLLALVLALLTPVYAESPQTIFVERQVYQYLTQELDMNSAAACGVLANIEHESAFNLTIVGDQGTSYGLCQWHNGRYSALVNFCNSQGLDYQSLEGQMRYLSFELKTSYFSVLASLRHVENSPEGAYRAAYIWCTQFERPANVEYQASTRGTTAQFKYWNRYNTGSLFMPTASANSLASSMVEEIRAMELDLPVYTEDISTSQPAPASEVTPSDAPDEQPEPIQQTTAKPAQRTPKKQFPIRQRWVQQTTPQSIPQPDYYTGVAIGLGLMPMGDGCKRKLELDVPEAVLI